MSITDASDSLRDVARAFSTASSNIAAALGEIKADLRRNQSMRRLLLVAIALDLVVTIAAAVVIQVNHTTVNVIKDCTQSTGRCYQENAKTQAVVIRGLNENTAAAAICAQQDPKATLPEVEACMVRLVKK